MSTLVHVYILHTSNVLFLVSSEFLKNIMLYIPIIDHVLINQLDIIIMRGRDDVTEENKV